MPLRIIGLSHGIAEAFALLILLIARSPVSTLNQFFLIAFGLSAFGLYRTHRTCRPDAAAGNLLWLSPDQVVDCWALACRSTVVLWTIGFAWYICYVFYLR